MLFFSTPNSRAMESTAARGTIGFLKKLPALRQSASPGTSSIPFCRRMERTASRTSAREGEVTLSAAKCLARSA